MSIQMEPTAETSASESIKSAGRTRYAMLAIPGDELGQSIAEYRLAAASLGPNRALDFVAHCTVVPPFYASLTAGEVRHAFLRAARAVKPRLCEQSFRTVCFACSRRSHEITLASVDVRRVARDFGLRLKHRLGGKTPMIRNRLHVTLASKFTSESDQALRSLAKSTISLRAPVEWRLLLTKCNPGAASTELAAYPVANE